MNPLLKQNLFFTNYLNSYGITPGFLVSSAKVNVSKLLGKNVLLVTLNLD